MNIFHRCLQDLHSVDASYQHAGRRYIYGWYIRTVNNVLANYWEAIVMAGKKPTKNRTAWAETTFVQFKLDKEQREAFRTWQTKLGTKVHDEIAILMANGHKSSISWDDTRNCWIVATTCKDEGSVNENCCLTSRAEDWYEGLAMNVYKATVMLADTPWRDFERDDDLG